MTPQNAEDREIKLFNPSRMYMSAEGLCSPWANAMGWIAPLPAPACVNITKTREKGEKYRVENILNPSGLLWPHKHIPNLFCLIRPGLTWPVGCYSAQILKPGEVTKLRGPFAALPKVSTMGSFFTITLFLAIRRTPSTSVTVTTMGRPSGMAATARLGTAEIQQLQRRGQTTSTNQNAPKGPFHGVGFPFIHVYLNRSTQH